MSVSAVTWLLTIAGLPYHERVIAEHDAAWEDGVEVWPTHVSGSLCGGNIGRRLSTTVGYERRANEVLVRLAEAGEPDPGMLLEYHVEREPPPPGANRPVEIEADLRAVEQAIQAGKREE